MPTMKQLYIERELKEDRVVTIYVNCEMEGVVMAGPFRYRSDMSIPFGVSEAMEVGALGISISLDLLLGDDDWGDLFITWDSIYRVESMTGETLILDPYADPR